VSNCRRPGAAVVGGTYGGSTAAARMLKMQKTKPGSRSEIGDPAVPTGTYTGSTAVYILKLSRKTSKYPENQEAPSGTYR
jgi:hypothetical protein